MKKFLFSLTAAALLISASCSGQVTFSSDFEGGSLGNVSPLDSASLLIAPGDILQHFSFVVNGKFDPVNPVDTSLAPSADWFCFQMNGVKRKKIYLYLPDYNINRVSYSTNGGDSWQHMEIKQSNHKRIRLKLDCDSVRFALYEPYTFSYLQQRIASWRIRKDVIIDTIGYSFEGRPLQLMHITDESAPADKKAKIWIHGRIHPSETPGSWLLDGLIEELTGDSPQARSLRKQIDFYILPFANPDGVANGLSRSNITGVNQEINFGRSEDSTVVEVKAIKVALERITAERPLDILINNHSQLAEFATFWMHRGSSSSMEYQRRQWTLTGLVSSMNPFMKPADMSFSDIAPRYVEGWIWERFAERTLAITLETPYTAFSNGEITTKEHFFSFGRRLLYGMAEYLELSVPGRIIVETPDKVSDKWSELNEDFSIMGKSGFAASRDGAKITYRYCNLPKGRYDIYMYKAGRNIVPAGGSLFKEDEDPGIHGWVKIDTTVQKRDGSWKYVFKAEKGTTADALLLISTE